MKPDFLEYAICLRCGGELVMAATEECGIGGQVKTGSIWCPSCKITFPIKLLDGQRIYLVS